MDYELVEKRRRHWDEEELPKLKGKVSTRVELLLSRCYMYGDLEKPLESITDSQFLSVYGFGPKTLADIRKVIPSPAS